MRIPAHQVDVVPGQPYDPIADIVAAAKGVFYYLSYLIDSFGSYELALAAYNAGPGNVKNWLADPEYSVDGKTLHDIPYPETEAYVRNVMYHYEARAF